MARGLLNCPLPAPTLPHTLSGTLAAAVSPPQPPTAAEITVPAASRPKCRRSNLKIDSLGIGRPNDYGKEGCKKRYLQCRVNGADCNGFDGVAPPKVQLCQGFT